MEFEVGPIEKKELTKRYNRASFSAALRELRPGESRLVRKVNGRNVSATCAIVFGAGNYATRKDEDGIRVWRLK